MATGDGALAKPAPRKPTPSALRVRLAFYSVAALFAIPYGALNSLNQNTQAVFGGAPGAPPAAVARADGAARAANVAISASWLACLFLVPAAIAALRGARNAFATMMFAWAAAGAALAGAYALGAEPLKASGGGDAGLYACVLLFGLLVGVFGGLGYTATEVYLDACAEWMPLCLEAQAAAASGGAAKAGPAAASDAAAGAGDTAAAKSAAVGAGAATPAPASAKEAAAEAALRRKATASRYKNVFASQMYAFAELGTVAFALPGALNVTVGRSMLYFLVAVAACLLAGAGASLLVPDMHEPPRDAFGGAGEEGVEDAKGGKGGKGGGNDGAAAAPRGALRACFGGVWAALRLAAQSAVQSVTCLSAYRWVAALAIVPYFLSAAWADGYFQFVISGTQCGLRDAPDGVGLSGVNIMALVGSAVQAAAAFAGPAMVGPRRMQFAEHVWPLALGNAAGAVGAAAIALAGGLAPRMCGSLGAMLAVKSLSSISYGINNSVGVAAVLVWYDGPYQPLVVSALASRSVWYQLGGVLSPYTFSDAFATQSGGTSAAWFAAAVYLSGSVCVAGAYCLNAFLERRAAAAAQQAAAAGADAEAAGRLLSVAELRLERTRGRMTAGFKKIE
ncbi:hypothetical protein Rsub_00275 [Raphidocelis subcapitata]|uniref:Uncharacterized protein n=1 Tax=Raphidocelis subcapitata TaxID=307507 RepID=A0A2V0NJX4_9CHLO|nr:hypothetical protein Rsub_00275 [Raphidocelis subcapitata]|eukprot:GBF87564.1 hypothetical protein Rsub_00275 [Raphidocelis subcapitata]